MKLNKIQGLVIKEVNTGEADKIVTIFSKRLGKVQAIAKGARRPQSRLIAGTQFLCFSDFVLFKGKELYNISDCEVKEAFYDIRTSLDRLTYASHIADLVNEVSEENLSYPQLEQLLLNTLHMLTYTDKSPELIARVFEIRLMSIIGFTPSVIECLGCSNVTNENILFSSKLGGIVCEDCARQDKYAFRISVGTLSTLRYIIYSEMKKVFSFDVSDNVLRELKLVSERFINAHLNKRFKKLEFLDTLGVEEKRND